MDTVGGFMFGLAVGALVAFFIGGNVAENYYRDRAVEHGCASYDPITGEWGWLPAARETAP